MNTKKLTQKYWFSLSEDTKYRALQKAIGHVTPEGLLKEYSKAKTIKELDFVWDILKHHSKMPKEATTVKDMQHTNYKIQVDGWWMS